MMHAYCRSRYINDYIYSNYRPPITPYNLFIHEISGAVKQEFPNATFSELPKIYSKKWNNLSAEEKQVCNLCSVHRNVINWNVKDCLYLFI